jgi:hypothetical protein
VLGSSALTSLAPNSGDGDWLVDSSEASGSHVLQPTFFWPAPVSSVFFLRWYSGGTWSCDWLAYRATARHAGQALARRRRSLLPELYRTSA